MGCPVKWFQRWAQTLFQRNFKTAAGDSACHAVSLSYNHQSYLKAEVYTKFIKRTVTNADIFVFIVDKIDTNKPWVTKPGHAPVLQATQRHTAEI